MQEVLHKVVKAIDDKKGLDTVVLDVSEIASFTDYFVICTGSSSTQMQTVADEVQERLRDIGMRPAHVEGYRVAEWILMDYIDFVVHVFSQKARTFYDLERLWRDAPRIEVADLLKAKVRKTGKRKAGG
jgi:ribosome-associated protein